LCGWLLPGPLIGVPAGAPRETAICAAVFALPYRFETSDLPEAMPAVFPALGVQVADEPLPPVLHSVLCVVAFVGFIPDCVPAFWAALPFVVERALPFVVALDFALCAEPFPPPPPLLLVVG
jgi:hypothetical protein